jgi:DNA repair protein RecN (Recombination protein N)
VSDESAARVGAGQGQLVELAVTDLGIIEHLRLVFGPGMTALTGETGAGKTLLVGAIDLLLGGRADVGMVRTGASEAVVEGRFLVDNEELVLSRVVPVDGRSRAYVNGRMATAAALAEQARRLVDLHGQHAHQALLTTGVQREALDRFAGIDLTPLRTALAEQRRIAVEFDALGGDPFTRNREADLLRFQLEELTAAALADPEEDGSLDEEEDRLADAEAHRTAAASAGGALADDGGAVDSVGAAIAAIDGRLPFADAGGRLHAIQADLSDLAAGLRSTGEGIEDDPGRLAAIRERRQLLADLRRKYAEGSGRRGTLADVIAVRGDVEDRLAAIEGHDARAAALDAEARRAASERAAAEAVIGSARRRAAPRLAAAVQAHLAELAMGDARLEVAVGDRDPGDDVAFLLAANPGSEPAPLAKVASGGELARAMLGLRLVLSEAPPVLVFDEVDAGIGGSAALAVGRSLASLGATRQVLVVTHLAQVAAYADQQVTVQKAVAHDRTTATAGPVDGSARVVELSRMLSGTPDSERVRHAAEELLARAADERGR